MRVPLTTRALAVTTVVSLGGLTACGGGGSSAGCAVPVREELDPSHIVHVTDPTKAVYRTHPPTSGVHLSTPAPTGLVDEALLEAVQVTILERGDVLVQYRDPADRDALAGLVRDHLVVAPQPTLPARVVVTAWTYKLTCSAVDTAAITKFADSHIGKGQEH